MGLGEVAGLVECGQFFTDEVKGKVWVGLEAKECSSCRREACLHLVQTQ